jgi:cold shock protein
MEQGSVKWFNDGKGYGVIVRDNGGEIFVHQAAILAAGARTLHQGQRVQFSAVRGLKGLQAEEVQEV